MTESPRSDETGMVPLDLRFPIWDRLFTVAPLVVVGTREGDGYDLAPKHMATPLGWQGQFGFVCTPAHATYRNVRTHGNFTVSYPGPEQVVVTSLTAAPRCGADEPTPGLPSIPTVPAEAVEGRVLRDAHLILECELDRIIDGFGDASLVVGRIVAARAHQDVLRTTGLADEEILKKAPVLAYLNPGWYTSISEGHAFPFPAGYNR
jgi:flavin reductase (DIM6/NTAB) family NADH-FMN oxidoreductase RutF